MLSKLYQEEVITEHDLEDLKTTSFVFNHLVCIQCTKSPDVLTKTAELLDCVNCRGYANELRGQCVVSTWSLSCCCVVSLSTMSVYSLL